MTHVRDGDTVELGERAVRLQGIDAPQSNQAHGAAAGRALRRLVSGERIRVETHGRGSHGRIIGTIHHGGRNVNAWLVRQGHAWAYDEYLEPLSALPALERYAELFQQMEDQPTRIALYFPLLGWCVDWSPEVTLL